MGVSGAAERNIDGERNGLTVMGEIKVSVIIPIYNVEQYLEACLKSVVEQTLREIEIICIDDCSTDGSMEVARKFAVADQRIILLEHDVNKGLSAARNTGLSAAKGEYIYFLDSDDYIRREALERLYDIAYKDKLDLVVFDSRMVFDTEALKVEMQRDDLFMAQHRYEGILSGKEFFRQTRVNNDMREPVWLQLVRHELLTVNQITFFEGILHEDILYSFLVMMSAKRMRCVNEEYHYYRRRENAITTVRGNEKNLAGLAKTYVEIFTYWKENEIEAEYHDAIEHYLDRVSWKVNRFLDERDDKDKVRTLLKDDPVTWHMFKLILEDPKPQSPRYRK